jgi:uncharacterized MAPEG superfamily protein
MPIAFWCVLAAVVLAYIPTAIPKGKKAVSGYDNARPRETQARFTGFSARAYGAHQNGLEAFGLFAVAVLTATVLKAAGPALDGLAIAWLILRVVYVAAYLADLPALRSGIWILGFLTAVAIFTLPAWR